MRLAVVLAPNPNALSAVAAPSGEPSEALDVVVGEPLVRLGFDVVVVDDDGDPVLGLERALVGIGAGDSVLVHASGVVRHGTTLTLDASRSISIGAIAATIALLRPSSAAVVIDVTHAGAGDSMAAAEHVEALREALDARARGQSALLAVRAESHDAAPFAFTRLALQVAEDLASSVSSGVGPVTMGAVKLGAIAERLRGMPESHTATQSFALVQAENDFDVAVPHLLRTARDGDEMPALEPLLALADGARYREAWEQALAGYQAALLVVGSSGEERANVYARIGALERARGRVRFAQRAFEKALAASPSDRASLDALIAIASAANEWRTVVDLSLARAEVLEPAKRGDELFNVARMLVEKLRDVPASAAALEKVRALEPHREDVLHALRRAYKVLKHWSNVIDVTGALGDISPSKTERAARRFAQAQLAKDRLKDETAAIAFLETALQEDPTHDEALDVLVDVRMARGELVPLEATLDLLATRLEDASEYERMADVNRRLNAIRRERTASAAVEPMPISIEVVEAPIESIEVAEDIEELEPIDVVEASGAIAAVDMGASIEAMPPVDDSPSLDGTSAPVAAVEAKAEPVEAVEAKAEPVEAVEAKIEPVGAVETKSVAQDDDDEISPPTLEFKKPIAPSVIESVSAEAHAVAEARSIDAPQASSPIAMSIAHDDESMLPELEASAAEDPLDAETHARLFALHVRAGREDRAYLATLALEELDALAPEHRQVLDRCRPEGLRLRALLDEGAWQLLRTQGEDDVLESLFSAISRAAIAAHAEDPRARRLYPSLDPSRRQPETSTASIVRTFTWASRALDIACPALYLMDEVPGDIAMVPAAEPSTVLGPGVLNGLSTKDLAFLAGRHLTYYRPEHAVLVHFPTLQELTVLVLAAVQIALPAMPVPAAIAPVVSALRGRLSRHLSEKESDAMAAAVDRIDARGGRVGLPAWIRGVELTAQRVGFFLAGDLRTAMTRIRNESRAIAGVTVETKRADLLKFCASAALAELRAEFAILTPSTPVVPASSRSSSTPPPPPASNRDLLAADYGSPEWTRSMASSQGGERVIVRGADSRP